MTDTSREAFEKWAVDIISDNPNWCESGDCELAWQSWQASRETEKAQAVATVQCVRGVTIGYLDVMQPVGTKLYTHPAQQVAVPAVGNTKCNPHPDAPHGFSRNASHSAGRYVCDCEGWIQDWTKDWSES
jgi:hypothetical protein